MALGDLVEKMRSELRKKQSELGRKEKLLQDQKRKLEEIKIRVARAQETAQSVKKQNEQYALTGKILEDSIQAQKFAALRNQTHGEFLTKKNLAFEVESKKKRDKMQQEIYDMQDGVQLQLSKYQSLPKAQELAKAEAEHKRLQNFMKVVSIKENNTAQGISRDSGQNDLLDDVTSFKEFCIRLAQIGCQHVNAETAIIKLKRHFEEVYKEQKEKERQESLDQSNKMRTLHVIPEVNEFSGCSSLQVMSISHATHPQNSGATVSSTLEETERDTEKSSEFEESLGRMDQEVLDAGQVSFEPAEILKILPVAPEPPAKPRTSVPLIRQVLMPIVPEPAPKLMMAAPPSRHVLMQVLPEPVPKLMMAIPPSRQISMPVVAELAPKPQTSAPPSRQAPMPSAPEPVQKVMVTAPPIQQQRVAEPPQSSSFFGGFMFAEAGPPTPNGSEGGNDDIDTPPLFGNIFGGAGQGKPDAPKKKNIGFSLF